MSKFISIEIKAFILLFVFSLNVLISFACSVGIDMGFNSKHHHDGENKAMTYYGSHHHDGTDNHHKSKGNKNNCCNDTVIKFGQIDKTVANTVKINFDSSVFAALTYIFYLSDVLSSSQVITHTPLARWCFPLPHDIRVSIQSFQI